MSLQILLWKLETYTKFEFGRYFSGIFGYVFYLLLCGDLDVGEVFLWPILGFGGGFSFSVADPWVLKPGGRKDELLNGAFGKSRSCWQWRGLLHDSTNKVGSGLPARP